MSYGPVQSGGTAHGHAVEPKMGAEELLAQARRAALRYKTVGWHERAQSVEQLIQTAEKAPGETAAHLGKWLAHAGNRAPRYAPAVVRAKRSPEPARRYAGAERLCIVTSFFNPCGYASRVRNFGIFAKSLIESGVAWRGIECAFGDAPFTLPEYEMVFRVRSQSVLWQKERLINLVVSRLPDFYTKVAWIDADILFSNPSWIAETSDALDDYAVVQPFTDAARLGHAGADLLPSFAYLYHRDPDGVLGPAYWNHGHTGYAWAGRREWIEQYGLYDACLSGTGDHLMAHGFVGDFQPGCLGIGRDAAYRHFTEWCGKVYPAVSGKLGFIDGTAFSLWHGPEEAKNYYEAVCRMREFSFDPYSDIALGQTGCWEWASERPMLHAWSREYFARRREDELPRRVRK